MYPDPKWLITAALLLTLCTSCEDDEIPTCENLEITTTDQLFESDPEIITITGIGNMDEVLRFDDEYLITTYSRKVVLLDRDRDLVPVLEDIGVRATGQRGETAYLCAGNGIFSYNVSTRELVKLHDCNCLHLQRTSSSLYFSFSSSAATLDPFRIYELSDTGIESVTEQYLTLNDEFLVLDDRTILAFYAGAESSVVHYDPSGSIQAIYTTENSPIQESSFHVDPFLQEFNGGAIFVAENGARDPNILYWDAQTGEWTDLLPNSIDFGDVPTNCFPNFNIQSATYSDVIIEGDNLYATTIFGGCRGLHKWDLTGLDAFTRNDFVNIRLASLSDGLQCLEGILKGDQRQGLTLYTQREIIEF